MSNQTVVILDFGGQYKELIARRVRECGVYSVIEPYDTPVEQLAAMKPIGIIFTGGPQSVYADDSPACDEKVFRLGVPILGICYGMQLMCHMCGGRVISCLQSEYGTLDATLDVTDSALFAGLESDQRVLMSHTDRVDALPEGFRVTAHTALCPVAAFENNERRLYGVQFHPEVENSVHGKDMLHNFLYNICHAAGDYSMEDYLRTRIAAVRQQVGNKRVLLGLSGGVDSSVCAALLSEALPGQLVCVYIDHGFMRQGETDQIKQVFSRRNLNFVYVDARERFLSRLKGVTDPEQKRKLIGAEFARTFEDEARRLGNPEFLAQGTIYPDIVESGKNKSAVIKSHHNVGGLPKDLGFEGVVEPLSGLFKDEVRRLGELLGLPKKLVWRQPFPGPGLAIRIIGEVTEEKLNILRAADAIVRQEIGRSRVRVDQYFAVLTDTRSVGVMGDFRTYERLLAVRAVRTNDFMTCEYARLPYTLLTRISSRITNEVDGINRVVYDITAKPPATIEWE
ncbi:MAG: glutamine-hydrolyzing GMP synthase [Eubacteriales bacterium]|nr:glutamine-hydrolyzing GMP synthase [Eubacteriales bacterium]MDY4898470.1 glutamine-hydrolyzing GMP synthase [Eubacteriales bacterium]